MHSWRRKKWETPGYILRNMMRRRRDVRRPPETRKRTASCSPRRRPAAFCWRSARPPRSRARARKTRGRRLPMSSMLLVCGHNERKATGTVPRCAALCLAMPRRAHAFRTVVRSVPVATVCTARAQRATFVRCQHSCKGGHRHLNCREICTQKSIAPGELSRQFGLVSWEAVALSCAFGNAALQAA